MPSTSPHEQHRVELVNELSDRLSSGEIDLVGAPLTELHERRDRRLRALVAHAQRESPWHRERLGGVDAKDLTAADLGELPVMTKADLVEHWDEIVCDERLTLDGARRELERLEQAGEDADPFWHDDYLVMSTGGSSGEPTIVAWDDAGWLAMCAIVMRYGAWLQAHGPDVDPASSGEDDPTARWMQVTLGSSHHRSMSRRLGTFLANPMVENHEVPANSRPGEMVAALNDLQPDGLFGYSTALSAAAFEARHGDLRISPSMVGASSEPLTPAMRRYLTEALGVEPSNTYAVTELGALAARTAPGGDALILVEDLAVYEPMRQANGAREPVEAGEWSDTLVITNVVNHALPLIRYELEDRVAVDDREDDFPWTGRELRLAGRRYAPFTYDGGATVQPAAVLGSALAADNVIDAAVHQTDDGVRLQIWADGPFDPTPVANDVSALLTAGGLDAAGVVVGVVSHPAELPRTPAGKRRAVVPRG